MGLSSWLQNLLAGKKARSARSPREDFVQLYLNRLEDRRVLSADFALVGNALVLDGFSMNEALTVRDAGASDYQFVLTGAGTTGWSTTDMTPFGTVSGTNNEILTVQKSDLDNLDPLTGGLQIVDPADGDLAITFENADFSMLKGSFEIIGAGSVTQTGASIVKISTFDVDAASLTLDQMGNDFGSVTLNVSADATLHDANSLILSDVVVGTSFNLDVASGQSTQAAGTTISGGMSLTTTGAGTLELSEANTYTGGTILNGGTLLVTNSTGSGTGTGNVAVNSGATLGGTGSVSGAVTVNTGGTLSPGTSPGVITNGNLDLAAGSSFIVELDDDNASGAMAGMDYDQVQVAGTVTIGSSVTLTVQDLGSTEIDAGDVYVIIANNGAGAVTGTFDGLAQGATLTIGGMTARINYFGGDGNDVVLEVEGPFTYNNTGGGDVTVRQNSTNGTIEIVKGGIVVDSRVAAGVTQIVINGDPDFNDALTVNYGSGGFFTQMITFDGGEDPMMDPAENDRLIITGGTFGLAVHTFTAPDAGNIVYDVDGNISTMADQATISYTGLEPVDMSGSTITDLVFNLPGTDDQAFLEDDGTAANGISQIRSNNGGGTTPTFETTTFANPTGSLTVNLGGDDATFTVDALPDFTAELTIDGQAGSDTVNFIGDLTLGSGTQTGNLTVINTDVVTFAAGTDIDTTPGTVGNVTIIAGQSITMAGTSTIDAGGDVILTATAGSVQLGQVQATGNMVTVTAGNQITDADPTLVNEGAGNENIIANVIVLNAVNGIGSGAGAFGEGEDIDINGGTLTATNTSLGEIQIFETDSIALDQVSNPGRTVLIDAGTGAITDADAADDTNPNITAGFAGLMAATGIGAGALGDGADIDTNVGTIAAVTTTGDINLDEADNLIIGAVGGIAGLQILAGGMDDDITAFANVDLTVASAVVNAGTGDVNLVAAGNLIIDANVTTNYPGNITLSGANVTIQTTRTVRLQGAGAANITAPNPRNGVVSGDGIITVDASITVTVNGTLGSDGRLIQITTNDLVIAAGGQITTGAPGNGSAVIVRNASVGRNIELGVGAGGGTVLGISNAELQQIQTDSLRIGRRDAVGLDTENITLTGLFAANSASIATVQLFAGANVTQDAGGSFQAQNIGIEAGGIVAMAGTANNADILAIEAVGSIQYRDEDALTVGEINDAVDLAEGQNAAGVRSNSFVELITDDGNLIVSNTSEADDIFAGGVNGTTNLAISLLAGGTDRFITINLSADVESTAGAHRYTADNMDIQGTISATDQAVNLRNANAAVAIDLGSATDLAASTLELSDAELDNITTSLLAIGRNTGNVSGNITVTDSISPDNTATLHLITGGTVTDAAGGAIIETNLLVEATGGGTLDNIAANDVETLAALVTGDGASFEFQDMNSLTVGTVNRLTVTNDANETVGVTTFSGIDTDGGDVTLITNTGVTVNEMINTTADDGGRNSGSIEINVLGTGNIDVNAPLITTGTTIGGDGAGGNISLSTADGNITTTLAGTLNAEGAGVVAGGDITITAGNGTSADSGAIIGGTITTNNGGNIEINADDDVMLNANLATTGAGTVTVTANNDATNVSGDGGSGSITMGSGTSISTASGLVTLMTQDDDQDAGNIIVEQITTSGDVVIDANGVNADVELRNAITTAGGSVTVTADDSVTFLTAGMIIATGAGIVMVRANSDGAASLDGGINNADEIFMMDGSVINAGTGTVTLQTTGAGGGNITVGQLQTDNVTAGAVLIESNSAVVDGGDTGGADIIANQAGSQVTITANTGIGVQIAGGENALETNAVRFDVNNAGLGALPGSDTRFIVSLANTTAGLPVEIIQLAGASAAGATAGADVTFTNTSGALLTISGMGVTSGNTLNAPNGVEGGNINISTDADLLVTAQLSSRDGDGGMFTQNGGATYALNAVIALGTGNITVNTDSLDIFFTENLDIINGPATFNAPRDIIVGDTTLVEDATEEILRSLVDDGTMTDNFVDATTMAVQNAAAIDSHIELSADSDGDGSGGVLVRPTGQVIASGNLLLEGSDLFADGLSAPPLLPGIENGVHIVADGNQQQLRAAGDLTLQNRTGSPTTADVVLGGLIATQTATAGPSLNILIDAKQNIHLASDTTIVSPQNVTLGDPVLDGAAGPTSNLVVNADGTTTFFGRVDGIDSLTTNAGGDTRIRGGLVNTLGSQTYNDAVFINADTPLFGTTTITAGGDVFFNSTVDGMNSGASDDLILNVTGTTTFSGGGVGGMERIGDGVGHAITINSTGVTIFNGQVFTQSGILQADTAGRVTFNGNVDIDAGDSESEFRANVTLGGMTMFSNGNLTFGSAIPLNMDDLTVDVSSVLHTSQNAIFHSTILTNGQNLQTYARGNIAYSEFNSTVTQGGMFVSIAGGSLTMNDQATLDANNGMTGVGGLVFLQSGANLTVSQIRSEGGMVALTSTAGAIIDAGDLAVLAGTIGANDIQAAQLRLVAGTGIGTTGNPGLETMVSNLEADNSGAGGILIFNTGDLSVSGLASPSFVTIQERMVTIVTLNPLAGVSTADGDIGLRVMGPGGNFTLSQRDILAPGGQVIVAADGTIDFSEGSGSRVQSESGTITAVSRNTPMVRDVITAPINADFLAQLTFTVGLFGESNFTAIVDWGDGSMLDVIGGLAGGVPITVMHQYSGPPNPANPGAPIQIILAVATDPNIHFFGNNNSLIDPGLRPLQEGPALPQPGQAFIGQFLDPEVPGLLFLNNVNQGGDFIDFALNPLDSLSGGVPFGPSITSLDVVTVFPVFPVPLNPIQEAAVFELEEVPPIFVPPPAVEAPPLEDEEFNEEADDLDFSGSDIEEKGEDEIIVRLRVLSPTGRILYEYEIEFRYLANPEPLWLQLRDGRYQIVIEEPGRSIPIVVRDVELKDHKVIRRFDQNRRDRNSETGRIIRPGARAYRVDSDTSDLTARNRNRPAELLAEPIPPGDEVWENWRSAPAAGRITISPEADGEQDSSSTEAVAASAGLVLGILSRRTDTSADDQMAKFSSRALSPAARLRRRLRR